MIIYIVYKLLKFHMIHYTSKNKRNNISPKFQVYNCENFVHLAIVSRTTKFCVFLIFFSTVFGSRKRFQAFGDYN